MKLRRSHHNQSGSPKIGYRTWAEAKEAAARRTGEWRVLVEPYACSECDRFHVGRSPRFQRGRTEYLEPEVGLRVLTHLGAENLGSPTRRGALIEARFRGAERVARRDRNYLLTIGSRSG